MRLVDVLVLPIIITSILILSLLGKALAIVIVVIGALFTPWSVVPSVQRSSASASASTSWRRACAASARAS